LSAVSLGGTFIILISNLTVDKDDRFHKISIVRLISPQCGGFLKSIFYRLYK